MKYYTHKYTIKMKSQSFLAIILATVILVACGEQPEGLDAKKAALTAAKGQVTTLKAEIASLEREIKLEDPDFMKSLESAILVTSLDTETTPFHHEVQVRGSVMSRTNMTISSEVIGQLKFLYIKEGQAVRKGEVIGLVDSENILEAIDEVQTRLDFAITVYEKRERLWKKNIGTEIQYLESKNNKETLEKQLVSLDTQLEKTKIKAPKTGVIERVPANDGELVQPGSPIAFLVSNEDMYITAEVSEAFIGKFKKGDIVKVGIPSLGETFTSSINSIGRVINAASRTYTIEVKLPRNEAFMKTNLTTVIHLTDYKTDKAIVIPSRIIQEDLKGNFVYRIEDNTAKKVHVELGLSFDNHTQVLNGLSEGDQVVDKGNRVVGHGSVVSIQD